jgi:hypothetical protein
LEMSMPVVCGKLLLIFSMYPMLVIRVQKPWYLFGFEGKDRGDPNLTRFLHDRASHDPPRSA